MDMEMTRKEIDSTVKAAQGLNEMDRAIVEAYKDGLKLGQRIGQEREKEQEGGAA